MKEFKFEIGDKVLVNGYLETYKYKHINKEGEIIHRKQTSQGNVYTIRFDDEERCLKVKEYHLIK